VTDEMLPAWPRFSPDGKRLAFMTQVIPARLHVASLADGQVTELGAAAWQCPPVWSSATRLWSFEGAGSEHYWSERDIVTGARTGQRKKLTGLPASQDEVQCWPSGEPVSSPFFHRLRAESDETTKLLQVPSIRAQ
jgi:dipeptidyl aminopeptidase/acylaminoacyl peptidase